jgi:hypothetical protein
VNCYPDGYTAPTYSPPHVCGWGQTYERIQRMKLDCTGAGDWAPARTSGHDLLPRRAIDAIAEMMAHMLATGKHGRDDWRAMSVREHTIHAHQHVANIYAGDTSEDHLLHAACRLLMAVEQRMTHDLPGFAVETDHVAAKPGTFDEDGDDFDAELAREYGRRAELMRRLASGDARITEDDGDAD